MNAVNQVQEASALYAVEQHALLKSFDLLATAPDGVARLRELILSLAVQGKLVPQDPKDEPASVLLERIRAEKQALIKTGKFKKEKPLAEIAEEEKPFELPLSWEWARFGEVLDFQGGGQPPKSKFSETPLPDYVRLIQIRDLGEKPQPVFIPRTEASKFCGPQDIMVGRYGASVGKVFWGIEGAYNVALVKMLDEWGCFNSGFLYLLLSSPIGQSWFKGISRSAQDGFNKNDIAPNLVPLAPLTEQSRIVARVEELMQLCDALEQQGKLEAAQHARLVGTLFDALANSESAHALAENWQRVAASFDLLLDRPEAVDALEQTLLQLAVRGLLVPQDPKDEPASELLKKIRTEKNHLIATGKLKRDKPLPEISEEEKPFELPQGWEWARVGNAFNTTSGNTFDASLERENGQYMYIKVGDMNLPGNALVITTATRFINPDKKAELALIPVGSIIFPKRGGAIATNKKRIIETPVFVDLNTMAITPVLLSTSYAYLWLLTVDLAELNSGTSVPQINHKDIDPLLFPLPPLAEQSRIVARVAELRELCADLRARLTAARTTQTHLAEALVEQAA